MGRERLQKEYKLGYLVIKIKRNLKGKICRTKK